MTNNSEWLEQKISETMKKLDKSPKNENLLHTLDKFISMKKKYSSAIDHLGEKSRVIHKFVGFVKETNPKLLAKIEHYVQEFLEKDDE